MVEFLFQYWLEISGFGGCAYIMYTNFLFPKYARFVYEDLYEDVLEDLDLIRGIKERKLSNFIDYLYEKKNNPLLKDVDGKYINISPPNDRIEK